MKSLTSTVTKQILFFILMLMVSELSFGQTSIEAIGNTYSQNFNGLNGSSWTDNSILPGWYARTDSTSNISSYGVNDGTITNEGLYSFGSSISIPGVNPETDRAFGFVPSNSFTGAIGFGKGYLGWRFKNNTLKTIGSIRIQWSGEQWRTEDVGTAQNLILGYQIGSSVTSLTSGTYTSNVSVFSSPIFGTSSSQELDGNDPANRNNTLWVEIHTLKIAPGEEIMLRWEDVMDPFNPLMAIDDVSFTALKEYQSITFNALPDRAYVLNQTFTLAATSSSGLPITYESDNSSVITISGNIATIIAPGNAKITASQAGNAAYAPATNVSQVQVILKLDQSITFNALPQRSFVLNQTFTLAATTNSGLPISYISNNQYVIAITGTTATTKGPGSATITASQAGDAIYNQALDVQQVQVIAPAAPVASAATAVGTGVFTGNWTPSPGGADEYFIYYSTDINFTTSSGASALLAVSKTINNLLANTTYYYRIQAKSGTTYSPYSNTITLTTLAGVQTSNIVQSINGFTSSKLTWSKGNMTNTILFLKDGTGSCPNPVDNINYTPNANWNTKGTQLGTSGFYCIYKSSNTFVDLSNLYPGRTYTVQAFEYNQYSGANSAKFLTTVTGTNNPITFTTWPTTTFTNSTGVTSAEDYATVARWDHATVPTAALHPAVKVYIDGNCEISTDAVASNLTINASHDATNPKLTINAVSSLMVTDTLTNKNGASALLIKSGSSAANGSLIFRNAYGSPVQATVQMYSKASKVGSAYKWQFFGIPVRTYVKNPTFVDGVNYVRKFNEAGNGSGYTTDKHWIQLVDGNSLTPFTGYEVTQAAAKTYSFTGELVTGDFNSGMLGYTSTAQHPGQHLIGNPYTAAINISDIEFGTTDVGIIENSVYLYNTGSLDEWTSAGSGTASVNESSTPGQYIVIPKNVAGRGTGIPGQIPSMQAFLVKVKKQDVLGWVKITYPANNAATSLGKNTTLQRAPSADLPCTRIDVKGANFGDRMWIFTEPTCTKGFDNGWDGYKEERIGTAVPKLYAKEASGNYQVNSVDNINNSVLGFVAGTGTDYTFTFTHQNIESVYPKLYLFDTFTGNYTNITQSGTQYSFASSNTLDTESRFKIVTAIDNTTETSRWANNGLKLSNYQNTILVQNSTSFNGNLELYDIAGRIIKVFTFEANATTRIPVSISAGSYIVKAQTSTDKITLPIIIR